MQFGEVFPGIEEFGFAALDLLDSAADLGAPFGTELNWLEATAQRAHELVPLLLGQGKRLLENLPSVRCHAQSLLRSALDGQINSARARLRSSHYPLARS